MPPLKNELTHQFGFDLFGSTALNSNAMAPIGLIRIPMKEITEQADGADVDNEDQTPLAFAGEHVATGTNFRLDGDRQLAAGWKHRAQDNLTAIRTLQAIEAEGRAATPAEQAILIKFCAFSSTELAQNIFRRGSEAPKQGWEPLADELEALVSAEEKAGLMRATQYAHYTPEYIVNAMWEVVESLGFEGGTVLEPGCGTGLFLAACPEAIAEKSFFSGIEADPITARIATLLYPESDIRREDFTKAKIPGDFDLAIGNPPFSDRTQRFTGVSPAVPLSLHDFFIAQSVYHLRPGGLAAFVVSRWTMDKLTPTARELIADVADLIGAIRLPERAMRAEAGTDVVVDLLFFRRRLAGEERKGADWMLTGEAVPGTADHEAFQVNRYFLNHPEMVLGEHGETSSAYGPTYTCKGKTTGTGLRAALDALPKGIHEPRLTAFRGAGQRTTKFYGGTVADGATIREGSYLVTNHRLHQVIDGVPTEIKVKRPRDKGDGIPVRQAEIIESLIPIRDAVRDILRAQERNRPYAEAQVALRRAHSKFVRNFGPINKTEITTISDAETGNTKESVRRPNLTPFADDPDVWLVASIEDYDQETGKARHGAIFTQRVIHPPAPPQIVTAADALSVCLHDTGRVDIDFIAEALGTTREHVEAQLAGTVFLNPETLAWETADAYLSGPVRTKLKAAITAAEADARFARNVEALKAAQPTDLKASEITARLGAPWIPASDVTAFCLEIIGVNTRIQHIPGIGTWTMDKRAFSNVASCTTEWGTERRHAGDLMHDALNSSIPQIFDVWKENGVEKRVLNAEETEAAKDKLAKIKTAFQNWIWTDAERAERLSAVYNETMNNMVPRHFNGEHLTLPGASTVIKFYAHQKRVIWRVISAGATYIAHAVGAGKTFSMAATVMEQKRLGLVTKTMMVVPGHCLAQASREFLQLYPTAKILVADETNFEKAKRQRFIARAATADWDCIIITHSAFRFISIPAAFERDMVLAQIAEFEKMLETVDSEDRVSRKQIEHQKETFEAKLENLKTRKDDLLTISEMGIDQIIVDEAQEFRKLAFATNQSTLKGVDPNGSQRAWDLYVKSRFIESINPGRALIMASGTPITNTMGELYTLQRFFAPDVLNRTGLQHFDAWASNFGESRTELELQPSGNYKPVTRFSEFVNVPELIDIFRSFADIVLKADLRDNLKLPRIATGKRQVITSPPSEMFKAYQRHLANRIKIIEARKERPKKGDDILLSVITDGRHAAIDLRLAAPHLPDDPQNKLNTLIDNAWRIYQETAANVYEMAPGVPYEITGAGQMIFSDLGTLGVEAKRGFSAYRWIKTQLIARGVPASEIAFMQDYKKTSMKQRLFAAFNSGIIRFLIGSTQTMGTGVNAQKRLKALHHLDVPWLPSDIEQREGRIDRQGNQNEEIEIYAYATLTSMDATMWQNNERKQRFIEASLSGDRSVRRLEDAGAQSNQFAMAKAIASGDQRLMQKAGLEAEIARLVRLHDAHVDGQIAVRRTINDARAAIDFSQQRIAEINDDIKMRVSTQADDFAMRLGEHRFRERKAAGSAILQAMMEAAWNDKAKITGEMGGFRFAVKLTPGNRFALPAADIVFQRTNHKDRIELPNEPTALGIIARMESALNRFEAQREEHETRLAEAKRRLAGYEPRLGQAFEFTAELEAKREELKIIDIALAAKPDEETADATSAADEDPFGFGFSKPDDEALDDDEAANPEMADAE